MTASLRGREPGSRGSSTAGRRYQAAQWKHWLRTLIRVWQWFVKCSHELYKGPINLITNSNPVYNHPIMWQYHCHKLIYFTYSCPCRFTPPGEIAPVTLWIGGWVGPRAGLDLWRREKGCPCRKWNPGRSAGSPSLYQLSYPDVCLNNMDLKYSLQILR
jgi:hypothetical protein